MKHLTDSQLLAYSDGELSFWSRLHVKLHLLRCWQCRANHASLEAQAVRFSDALYRPAQPAARMRFEAWRWRFEQAHTDYTSPSRRHFLLWPLSVLPIFLFGLWILPPTPPPLDPALPHPSAPPTVATARNTPTKPPTSPNLELEVHYRLHRLGVCAAEPVLITRLGDGRIEVSAVGPPQEREREMRSALADLVAAKRILLRFTAAPATMLLAEGVGAPAPKAILSKAMLESEIPQKFSNFEQSARFALLAADEIYANAWAIKRHAGLPLSAADHDRNAFWLQNAMQADHLKDLRKAIATVQRELKPILRTSPVVERLRSHGLFELAGQFNSQLQHFFQSEQPDDLDPISPAPDELWATLQALDEVVTKLARATASKHPQR